MQFLQSTVDNSDKTKSEDGASLDQKRDVREDKYHISVLVFVEVGCEKVGFDVRIRGYGLNHPVVSNRVGGPPM